MIVDFETLESRLAQTSVRSRHGQVQAVRSGSVDVIGLARDARIGDFVEIDRGGLPKLRGEVVSLSGKRATLMPFGDATGTALGQDAKLLQIPALLPCEEWVGRVIDAFGEPLDNQPLKSGQSPRPWIAPPPPAADRRGLGVRLHTGFAALDTMLPLVRGQRIGVFAGSGVGKTSVLAGLARNASADVIVLGLIGERGRELRAFLESSLGPEGLARSVVVAATSDESPLVKRRAAWTAMAIAEHFRDRGKQVLLLLDSITRFAESHREVALTAGEAASLRAYPPSTSSMIAALAERAGPGIGRQGDITAVFSVLVAGSDMEEPVADITRGVLDGHVILDREIAERGRFPAFDVRRSVSRSLPDCASADQNELILRARRMLGVYEAAAPMIQTGLYVAGSDPEVDAAIKIWSKLDQFFGTGTPDTLDGAFATLAGILALADSEG